MRCICLFLGCCLLAAVWLGPLPERAVYSFAAHMSMHMGIVAVAAPLLALGVAGGTYDPVRKAPTLFAPIPVSLVELLVVWAWHAPALHHAARQSAGGLMLEQGMFLLSGLLVWLAAFGGEPRQRSSRAAAGVIALLLTSMHMTLLGALLALPTRPLYVHAADVTGLTPLQDQQLGGAIMLVVGGVSYLTGGLWLTAVLLRGRPPVEQPAESLDQSTRDWHARLVTLSETKCLSERFFAALRMTRLWRLGVKCTNLL